MSCLFSAGRLRVVLVSCCFLVLSGCTLSKAPSTSDSTVEGNGYASVLGMNRGAVASVNPIATQAGINALRNGGNAIDAALAVAFTLGVVDSHNSGVGGGCFILARLADGRVLAIDGREMAPAKAHRDMYVVDGKAMSDWSKVGSLAVGIPGSVAALYELQQMAGKLSFGDVLLPAAAIARTGFAIDKTMAKRIEATQAQLSLFPASASIFLGENGLPLKEGDHLVQTDLAQSYESMAEYGKDWFYKGEFADLTGKWMAQNGGVITAEDFHNYRTVQRKPVESEFRGYTILGFPAPSSGGTHVAQILSMLNDRISFQVDEAERLHLVGEAMRRAFADRAQWMGDSDFVSVPQGLLDKDYLQNRISTFDPQSASSEIMPGHPPLASDSESLNKHTTHIATADGRGNWVAITTTLNTSFGSKVVIPGTGIVLNNQMDDFSIQPGVPNAFGLVGAEANSVQPGKRPLSSMSPTIVLKDGKPVLTLGAAGGPTIISQVAQALLYRLAGGDTLQRAISQSRVHQQWKPDILFVEPTVSDTTQQALLNKGHVLKPLGSFGATQGIEWVDNRFFAVTEPRLIQRNSD